MKRYLFIVLAGCCLAAGCRKIELVNPTEYEVLPFGGGSPTPIRSACIS